MAVYVAAGNQREWFAFVIKAVQGDAIQTDILLLLIEERMQPHTTFLHNFRRKHHSLIFVFEQVTMQHYSSKVFVDFEADLSRFTLG